MQDGYLGYYAELPADSVLPCRRRDAGQGQHRVPAWRQPLESDHVNPATPEEQRAWFLWLTGHQHLFLYWLVIAHACRAVTQALQAADLNTAAFWLQRVSKLILGSTASMLNSSDFDSALYLGPIRQSMDSCREDFSAFSAHDYAVMKEAVKQMERDLGEAREAQPTFPAGYAEAEGAFKTAWATWFERHTALACRLAPGMTSLLRAALRRMQHEQHEFQPNEYIKNTVRGPEALADYDRYFGVVRVGNLSLDDLWLLSIQIIARIHYHTALPPGENDWMMQGDSLLLTILAEEMAKRGPAPTA
jgi:hypothetical protein